MNIIEFFANMKEKRFLGMGVGVYIGVPVLIVALMAIFYYLGGQASPVSSTTQPSQNVESTSPAGGASAAKLYSNSDFRISVEYPSSWKPVVEKGGYNGKPLYFEGTDGFFGIDAIGTNTNEKVAIDDIVKDVASDDATPYGISPSITSPDTGTIKSRLIVPSSDQPADKNGETALIVEYPKPVKIGTDTFLFFMLYGDRAHLGEIAATLQLIDF